MVRPALFPALVVILTAFPAIALAEDEEPTEFLARARAAHADLIAEGLRSFTVDLVLRRSREPGLLRAKEQAGFGYSFTAPAAEEFDFHSTHESLQKSYRETCRGLWRDVTGALWFDVLDAAGDLRLVPDGSYTTVFGQVEKVGEVRGLFETLSTTMVGLEFPGLKAGLNYLFREDEGGRRVRWREVTVGDVRKVRMVWSGLRVVNGFRLPTILRLDTEKNVTEYALVYRTINGKEAVTAEPDEETVKTRVSCFEADWRKGSDEDKVEAIRELAEIPHDLVSASIAKLGLKDRSPDVRRAAADSLGVLARPNTVFALIAAMKRNEDEIHVYLSLIFALGEIGDPRAVDVLSRDWWNQRIGEYGIAAAQAKIRALGKIRHASSVDALLDIFTMAKDDNLSRLKVDLILALRGLTGQSFDYDREAWKDWWKANRARHRFED